MRQITQTIFKFSELDKKIQEKVLDKHREWNVEDSWWYECEYDYFHEQLLEKGLDCKDFSWNLEYRTFCLNKPVVKDDNKLLIAAGCEKELILLKIMETPENIITVEVGINESHRDEANGCEVNIYCDDDEVVLESDTIRDSITENVDEFLLSLCEGFRESLQEYYDEQTSDEAIADSLEANDFEFLATGEKI